MFPVTEGPKLNAYCILVGPTVTGPVQDPLAVQSLDNRLYIPQRISFSPNKNILKVF